MKTSISCFKQVGQLLALLLLLCASSSAWGQEVRDELTVGNLQLPSTYGEFPSYVGTSGAMYAGKSRVAAEARPSFMLSASTTTKAGIVVTTPGGIRVRSILVEWDSVTNDGCTLSVYGKNEAYKSADDLYSNSTSTIGTSLGSIKKGTTTLTIDGDYAYVGVKANNYTAYIVKLTIVWETSVQTQVGVPEFSPADGTTFSEELTVTASCATEGATIYYTTDGTTPTTESSEFPSAGLTINATTTIKAVATADGLANSEVTSATYTLQKAEPEVPAAAWSAASYTVDIQAASPVYPAFTTNSDGDVTYASSRTDVATIDANGAITLVATGVTTITASVAATDNYSAASASYVLTVEDGSSDGATAIVASSNGAYYAMLNTDNSSPTSSAGNDRLDAKRVVVVNGHVIDEGNAAMRWYVDYKAGTIQDVDGKYVAHPAKDTKIQLQSKVYHWTWNGSIWVSTTETSRALRLYTNNNQYFRAYYAGSDADAVPMPFASGYSRTVTAGRYGTICLPYAVEAGQFAGAEFFSVAGKRMTAGEATSIVLSPVAELEAGVPYIFLANSDTLGVIYTGEAVATATEVNGLVGSFESVDSVQEGMYLLTNNTVQLLGELGGYISANRAYFDLGKMSEYTGPTASNMRVIGFDGTTGVASITAPAPATVDVYSVGGVLVRSGVPAADATAGLAKGIYIVGGKKTVVK